ncbi:uncharacterized protein BDR25DRAFT_359484 [Lindgomyces ingoldianus]|uniref:Uncharacterized protein n=1 Tax=Lindgomyces ingoldianus TaxID=673940 RepID=A0ACB6QI64_9PLEO|nr:uncharacterized protein BDR25DRAFT_359484 [Lindgomyces ingoldianus]KAF2466590.1 hypothetical protein BDR25DRAFT_359484 [Lindgomyces ingoldianus]
MLAVQSEFCKNDALPRTGNVSRSLGIHDATGALLGSSTELVRAICVPYSPGVELYMSPRDRRRAAVIVGSPMPAQVPHTPTGSSYHPLPPRIVLLPPVALDEIAVSLCAPKPGRRGKQAVRQSSMPHTLRRSRTPCTPIAAVCRSLLHDVDAAADIGSVRIHCNADKPRLDAALAHPLVLYEGVP